MIGNFDEIKFEWNFSCKFKVILVDFIKFKICNQYTSILEGSHQDPGYDYNRTKSKL